MEFSNVCNIEGRLLSLPEGLKELMSDITTEVLRAQPQNVYEFIAAYLAALLDVRNSISIAGQVCDDIHDCSCDPELDEELRKIGLIEEDMDTAMGIIKKYFKIGGKETSLFLQLSRKTSIEHSQLEAVQTAVQRAFQKHRLTKCGFYQVESETSKIKCIDNLSSTSLAGSFVTLPKYIPYSVHNDTLSDISERTFDTHASRFQNDSSPNKSRSYTVNTLYKHGVLDKQNIIRFKAEIVKYINNNDRNIADLIDAGMSDVESDALPVNTDSNYKTSSSEQ